ncbi:YBR201C-A [Saccharomyces arboricola H-6]|uniref:YBR201C-A n=1 Tax=Saccharomyces arboricola (strain H-6 / AS 2.3317 / CBS 10644) TaxID=1160507 RepID=J8Q7Z8_SACAR|nr:YBR201C-A [Saccharomyces arboricola H-6]
MLTIKRFSLFSKAYKPSASNKKLTTLFYVAYITLGLTTPFLLPARMASKDVHYSYKDEFCSQRSYTRF